MSAVSVVSAIPWYAWVAVVAIIGSVISGIVGQVINHRERMAMIAQGMHPDAPNAAGKERLSEL